MIVEVEHIVGLSLLAQMFPQKMQKLLIPLLEVGGWIGKAIEVRFNVGAGR